MGRDADTHVRVRPETWEELNKLKSPGDTFDDVINQLLDEHEDSEGNPKTEIAAD